MKKSEMKFYCSQCDQPLRCDIQFAGRQIQRPGCLQIIRIPNSPSGSGFTQIEPKAAHAWDTSAWGG